MKHILQQSWFFILSDRQKQLVKTAVELYEREIKGSSDFSDYAFIVFPMSKAYEGFLKQIFFDLGLIDKKAFEGNRFRIGKALNPDINQRSRDEFWLYDDLEKMCSTQVAQELWETWLHSRNRIFHYFQGQDRPITLEQAGKNIERIANAMKLLVECQKTERSYYDGNRI